MLKLVDANKAAVYGLPAKDLEEGEALKLIAHLGKSAGSHLEDAIASGAFRRDSAPKKYSKSTEA